MKKNALYVIFLSAIAMVGCEGNYDDWADPQGFEQEEARSISVTAVAASSIDMAEVTSDSLVLFTPTVTMEEEDEVIGYKLVLNDTQNIPVTTEGKASVEDLKNAIVVLYGQAPIERSVTGTVTVQVLANGSVMMASTEITLSVTLYVDFNEFIYVAGNQQGWVLETAAALRSPSFDGVYTGFSYLDGDFKFSKSRVNWDEGEYGYNDFSTFSSNVVIGEGSNFSVEDAGFYQIIADVSTGSLTLTSTVWGILGTATSAQWEGSDALDMTWNTEDDSWSITTDLQAGELKFVANKSWDINLGGTVDNLSFDGDNISIGEDGNYTINLYLTRSASENMCCTITKN